MMPSAVQYNATEMPRASSCGLDPACCDAKMWIMPITVPKSPQRGDRTDRAE
jgi:hypothetical protein